MRFNSRNLIRFTTVLVGAAALAIRSEAAISVGPSGTGPLTFDMLPAVGEFATTAIVSVNGGAAFTTTAAIDAFVVPTPVATIVNASGVLPGATTVPPNPYAYAFRHNATGLFLQSRPTTSNAPSATASAATIMLATLQNDTGSDQSSVTVSYDMGVTDPVVGELPGFRVYFSVTGEAQSWQVIPELSSIETNGQVSATLNLNSWPSGSLMYLLWVDDNANGVTDPGYTIDNLSVGPQASTPVALVSSPTSASAEERQSLTLHVGASGSALQYQWFHDGAPMENLSFCTNGHDRTITGAVGSGGANLVFSSIEPIDAGQYLCVITNFSGAVTSLTATVIVNADTTPPRIRFALHGPSPNSIILYLSEPLNDSCVPVGNGGIVTDLSSWYVEELIPGQPSHPLGVDTFTNSPGVTGATVIGLNTFDTPLDPSNLIRITIQNDLPDTSVAQNILPFNTVIYVGASTNELVALNHSWRYNDQDIDPGPNWFASEPAGFLTGPGPFDAKRDGGIAGPDGLGDCRPTTLYGLGAVGTCLRLQSPVTQTNLATANFWTHFNLSADPGQTILHWEGKVDDGAVLYLNGQELQRLRMPAAPVAITRATLASPGVNDADAQDVFDFIAPPSLRAGDNLLAVELHQATLNSSDLTMGLRLSAVTPPTPRLSVSFDLGFVILSWQPDVGELQYTDGLAPTQWIPVPGAVSGYSEPVSEPHRFFRVVLP